MAESIMSLTIFVDNDGNRIHFYMNGKDGSNTHTAAAFQSATMDEAFFNEFDQILGQYRQKYLDKPISSVSLLLPDNLFLTDMITIPNMGKKAVENSLGLVIGTVYKNKADLTYNTFQLTQTKQTELYGLVGARTELLKSFRNMCAKNGLNVQNITFVSNAMADGAMAINQKLRNATCLLLDIKENSARFAFLNKGRTLGAYSLPFGCNVLCDSELVTEEQLFDYSSARQLVRNAREKARANAGEEEILFEDEGFAEEMSKAALREKPATKQGFIYENFRIFVKWTLELIAANPKITVLGKIDTVYVNMPAEYHFLFDLVNKEVQENGAEFAPMLPGGAAPKILEMLGGLQVKLYNKINNF